MKKRLYIETYGCQMNFSDSEIVVSIMTDSSYELTENIDEADIIFVNTCSIRDNAEQRIRNRLKQLGSKKHKNPDIKIGLLGCMAGRLKEQLLAEEDVIDIIVGPDAYRDLPRLLSISETGQKAANVLLSADETYSEIEAVRYDSTGISAYISIMRGCENFCSYCVVPYTRGKERSREPETILNEAKKLYNDGYREITLLGQNVNSYKWDSETQIIRFPELIKRIADISPDLRIRFATSHPKDLSDELIRAIATTSNICSHVHLPVQSGSSAILKKMNRKYDREWYLSRIAALKSEVPDIGLSTDIITGFCDETDEDHAETLSIMREVGFSFAFMFKYSERPGTKAFKQMDDNVEEEVKSMRLKEIIDLQQDLSKKSNLEDVGKTFVVLADSISKKSDKHLSGRNEQNKVVVFPMENYKPGDFVNVKIADCTSATLLGIAVD